MVWLHQVLVAAWGTFDLPCSMQDLSVVTYGIYFPDQRTELRLPALRAWSLSHWTTREVLAPRLFQKIFLTEVFLIYNVLISAIQQSCIAVIYIYIYKFSYI